MAIVQDLYPSRQQDKPEIIERKDPVINTRPEDADGSGLTAEQLRQYERDGFIALPQFFTPEEVAVFRKELTRMTNDPETIRRQEAVKEPNSDIVRSIFCVHKLSSLFDRLSRHPRLLAIAGQILGGGVYIHQSRVNMKPGFKGQGFYWHSDFETWHVEDGLPRMRTVSCSITLTENNEFNGPLMLIPGSQNHYIACVGETPEDNYKSSLRAQKVGTPDDESLTQLAESGGIKAPKGPAGTVLLFDCNTMHGSNSNISPFPRSNVFFVYNSIENAPVEPWSGQKPRPPFIAEREDISPLEPTQNPDFVS